MLSAANDKITTQDCLRKQNSITSRTDHTREQAPQHEKKGHPFESRHEQEGVHAYLERKASPMGLKVSTMCRFSRT